MGAGPALGLVGGEVGAAENRLGFGEDGIAAGGGRVVTDAGLAYVADYTGGLRIYRASGPDTSLVGVLPATGFERIVDLAIDPSSGRAYIAAMSGGLQVVDITDPTAPALHSSLPFPEQVSSVAVIDRWAMM